MARKREEIRTEDTWAIEDLYASNQEWEAEYAQIEKLLASLQAYEGKLGESAESLLGYLQLTDQVNQLFERVYVYANQRLHENLGNSTYQALSAKAADLEVKLSSATAFAQPEILEIPKETLEHFLEENKELQLYKRSLAQLYRQKAHYLDGKTEQILAMSQNVSSAASDVFAMFNNADIRFDKVLDEQGNPQELTHGNYVKFLESPDPAVRKGAFTSLYKSYSAFKNTLAATFYANVKQADFYAKVRGYSSSRAMALDASEIPESVYDNLIDVVHKRMPLMHRYVSLRKKALGVDKLHMYDLYTPMVTDVKIGVPFSQAKEIVKEGLAPMGEAYLKVLEEGFQNRWIDIYENEGKRSGAYSWGAYGTHPYVLLNYQENLDNIFTLAHEMGHALHSYYSDSTQPYPYAGYRIFVAEVASTCNESLLIHHMIKQAKSTKEKAYLINHFLDQFKGTLYRQTMFAEFERDVHKLVGEGEALTAELLCNQYYELNKTYFGKDMVVDSEIAMEWARIPHFYNPFYVYQYATGFSAAIALSKGILERGEEAVADYMKFLTGGSSTDPISLLKLAGVDMSSPQPIEAALDVFEDLLNQMEQLL